MANVKLAIGDIVVLRSGGPKMTISKDKPEQGSKFVQASWFDGSHLCQEIFHKDALNMVEKLEVPGKEAAPASA